MMLVMNALSENNVITLSATSPAPHIVTYCDEDDGDDYEGGDNDGIMMYMIYEIG